MSEHRVWKFPIPMPDGRCRSWVTVPPLTTPISVGLQDDAMVLWALVDIAGDHDLMEGPHRLIVANTGDEIPDFPEGSRFLGTLTSSNGIVWHVWDGDAETTA